MSDATYQPKVYKKSGGDVMVVASGGQILVEPGGSVMGGNPTGAADYFVDLNVSATGDGSMQSPFATIAEAITASNTSIGLTANRWWARRNRIFVMGDGMGDPTPIELTTLPEKCDIIGCGSDLYPFPRVIGVHTIAAAKVGCRFINMGFQATGTDHVLTAVAGCHGLSFLGCVFTASTAGNTLALELTDCAHVRIQGCKFLTPAGAITTSIFALPISIAGTASIHDFEISDNFIFGTAGIKVANGTTQGSVIARNIIRVTTGLNIEDLSDDVVCVDNRFINADAALAVGGFCDWNPLLAVGNLGTSDQASSAAVPIAVVCTT